MKIVFILPGSGNSGGVRVTVAAANLLVTRGHSVRILCKNTSTTLKSSLRNIKKRIFFKDDGWLKDFNGKLESFDDIVNSSFYENEVIVGVGMWSSAQLARLGSVPNPKVQYIHGATPWNPELMKEALSMHFPKLLVASYLIPVVKSFNGGPVLDVIYNGIDTSEYFSCVDTVERNGVGTIYSSHPAKDPDTVLAVLKQFSAIRPDIPIRVFSTDRRPRHINKNSFSRFPSVETAREIYSKSLVWVMGSKSEGFPAPVLEAMACGCAVVSTDCGGTNEMITSGENGFLVKVGDVEQIVDKVKLLLDDDELRKRICLNAKKTVKKFTWDKSIDRLENILEGLKNSNEV